MQTTRRRLHGAALAASLLALAPAFALAQADWPTKPIRIIVPYTPGGFTDITARTVALRLQERLKQPITIDNKPGANGIVGTEATAKSAPDGYTFVMVIAAICQPGAARRGCRTTASDLTPVSLVGTRPPLVLANHLDLPVKNVAGAGGLREGESRQAELRLGRDRRAAHLTTEL